MSLAENRLTRAVLEKLATKENFSLGRSYFIAERVKIVQKTQEKIRAHVLGQKTYTVDFFPEADDGEPTFVCNCEYSGEGVCKHSAALGFALERQNEHQIQNNGSQPSKAGGLNLSSISRPNRATVRRLKPWESFVKKIVPEREALQSIWTVVFFLEAKKSYWNLYVKKAFVKRDGTLGRLTRMSDAKEADEKLSLTEQERFAVSFLGHRLRPAPASGNAARLAHPRQSFFEMGDDCGLLFDLLRGSKVYLEREQDVFKEPIRISPEKGVVQFRTELRSGAVECRPVLKWAGIREEINEDHLLLTKDPIWLLRGETLIQLEEPTDPALIFPFQQKLFELSVPNAEFPDFMQSVQDNPEFAQILTIHEDIPVEDYKTIGVPRLYLRELAGRLETELRFSYGDFEFDQMAFSKHSFKPREQGAGILRIQRDQRMEQESLKLLEDTGAQHVKHGVFAVKPDDSLDWMIEKVQTLIDAGFDIIGENELEHVKVRRATPNVEIEVKSRIDWFDFKLIVDFDGVRVSLSQLRKALKAGVPYVLLNDGSTVKIPDEWLRRFQHLMQLSETIGEDDTMQIAKCHATFIDLLAAEADAQHTDSGYKKFVQRLKNFSGIPAVPVPDELQGELRPYQKSGLHWMIFLQNHAFGGCLADDMGLGKTVQTITLLLHEKSKHDKITSLIVAPTSVIFNWEREVEKFGPTLKILRHTGVERQRDCVGFEEYDIILTSYGVLRRDIEFLKDFRFHYAILDESQNIKNPGSQTAKASRVLTAGHRLALTGTPVENRTLELWSQMTFLNPGLLGTQRYFQRGFANAIENRQDAKAADLLQRLVFPFILRRRKEQVELDLPPKTESILYARMSPEQEKVYNYWRDYYRAAIIKEIEKVGLNNSRFTVLEGLIKLRQIACHPMLIDAEERDSGKFDLLASRLEIILSEGHKVLVFSQFVKMLKLLRGLMEKNDIVYEYLDGSTQNREQRVNNFQENKDVKAFLISLRAGGTGLNLTAADYVIHYDPWWNPAVEIQATDRSHRIGQDKHVFVYKLITKNSVEEKVLELQDRKKDLVDQLITTDQAFFKNLTRSDIESLFL